MRILVLSFYYEPDLSAGSFRAKAFVKALQKKLSADDAIEVITTMPNRYGSFSDEALGVEKYENITIDRIDLGSHKSGFFDQSKLFLSFYRKTMKLIGNRERYDIVYSTSSRLMTAFLGARVANRQHAKLFLDLRDIFPDTLSSIFSKRLIRHVIPIFRRIEKYTVRSANQVNLVSQGFCEYFLKIDNAVKYSVYTNGIDEMFLNYNFTKAANGSEKIITYAGNIGEGQGLEKIVPQMAKYLGSGYEIRIIGDGGRRDALVASLVGIENVKLLPPVTRSELLVAYCESDYLLLHLNDYEAFKKVLPSKLFEYAATNKAIIAGVGGYAARFIADNIDGAILFNPCSISEFKIRFEAYNEKAPMNRDQFVRDFSRCHIMECLAQEVCEL